MTYWHALHQRAPHEPAHVGALRRRGDVFLLSRQRWCLPGRARHIYNGRAFPDRVDAPELDEPGQPPSQGARMDLGPILRSVHSLQRRATDAIGMCGDQSFDLGELLFADDPGHEEKGGRPPWLLPWTEYCPIPYLDI